MGGLTEGSSTSRSSTILHFIPDTNVYATRRTEATTYLRQGKKVRNDLAASTPQYLHARDRRLRAGTGAEEVGAPHERRHP